MKQFIAILATFGACAVAGLAAAGAETPSASWNSRAAATYLDGRMDWWLHWPNAARDHDTSCVSCHTALPYGIARAALRNVLGERDMAAPERAMVANIVKRVKLWNEVEPFYPDQTRGLPKSSESRGSESIMNAAVLAMHDAATGTLSEDTRLAFANMWALQFKARELKGGWAWLNFHNEPWEGADSDFYGAALAALAVGTAPGGYAASPDVQEPLRMLREYLQQRIDRQPLFNRATALWASSKVPGLLTVAQRQSIVDAAISAQQIDGGWTMSTLGSWKRNDGSLLDTASDGYATAVMTLALKTGVGAAAAQRGIVWLSQHQDPKTGMWVATSLNKQRDPATDGGKFMNDAATAYAVLALSETTTGSNGRTD
jgi:squalene-hopene/tetraprenyl-beta-curcumene cyclase